MKIVSQICMTVLAATLVAGCGKDAANNTVQDIKNAVREPKLMKTWASTDCRDTKILDASKKEFLRFSGKDFARLEEFYDRGNCTDPLVSLRYKGSMEMGDEMSSLDGARQVTFKNEKVVVVPLKQKGVDMLNLVNFCGVKDWQLNVERDITADSGKTLCPAQTTPKDYYNILKIEEDFLYLGEDKGDLSEVANRPTVLDRKNNAFQASERDVEIK